MNILAFADTRTSLDLPKVKPDIVLLLGDIPSLMISRISRTYDCPKIGILGNHCHPANFEDTGVQNIHGQIITYKGFTIAGFEGSPIYKVRPFGQHSEEEASSFVESLRNHDVDILITHSNPAYGDIELDDAHRGFQAFNRLIFNKNKRVKLFFHGHLHDPFKKVIENTTIYSVYPYLWLPDVDLSNL